MFQKQPFPSILTICVNENVCVDSLDLALMCSGHMSTNVMFFNHSETSFFFFDEIFELELIHFLLGLLASYFQGFSCLLFWDTAMCYSQVYVSIQNTNLNLNKCLLGKFLAAYYLTKIKHLM